MVAWPAPPTPVRSSARRPGHDLAVTQKRRSYTSIVIEREIAASRQVVWDAFLAFIEKATGGYDVEGDPPPHGLGATLGLTLDDETLSEEVISFEPPWRRVYELTGAPVKMYQGTTVITDRGDSCLLAWSLVVDPLPGGASDSFPRDCGGVPHRIRRPLAGHGRIWGLTDSPHSRRTPMRIAGQRLGRTAPCRHRPNARACRSRRRGGFPRLVARPDRLVDALTVFPAVADAAPGLELGSAVIPTFPRHPTMLAGQALTTQAVLGDRDLVLGIGLSHKPAIEGYLGLSFDRPIRHLIDYLEVLMPLLDSGRVDYDGEAFTTHMESKRPGDRAPSVMVAALGEQTLRVTGRRTDGTILWMVGPRTIADHIRPRITAAAAEVGRPDPRIVASLPVCVTGDAASVREAAARIFAIYGELPSYRAMLDREGAATPGDVASSDRGGGPPPVSRTWHRLGATVLRGRRVRHDFR